MRLVLISVILILISATNVYSGIIISEIMYDPNDTIQCPDANCEYIEIYNPTNNPIDLNNWRFCNDSLLSGYVNNTGQTNPPVIKNTTAIIQSNSYAIISDGYNSGKTSSSGTKVFQKFNVSENSITFHVDKSDLCSNGLSNNGELIFITDNENNTIDYFDYSNSLGQGSGNSLQKMNTSWCYSNPTPGYTNNCNIQETQQENKQIKILNLNKNIYNNGTPIDLIIEFINFDNNLYDLKMDIKTLGNETVGKVYNNLDEEWQSSNNYLNNVLLITNSNLSYNLIIKIDESKNYIGDAILQAKLRRSGSTSIIARSELSYLNVSGVTKEGGNTTNLSNKSFIKIINYQKSARFGDKMDIDVEVYRGDTLKSVVYFYIEDKEKRKVSSINKVYVKSKFSLNESTINLELKCKDEKGDYKLVGNGLGISIKEDIEISNCDIQSPGKPLEEIYQIYFPDTIWLKEEFKTKIRIKNIDNESRTFSIWSYVYKGSKCYSCFDSREENTEQIEISSNSIGGVELNNVVENAKEGEYKLRVRILKENLKTPKDFTYNITIEEEGIDIQEQEATVNYLSSKENKEEYGDTKISGETIYESSDIKTKNKTIYILTITLLLIIAIMTFRKGYKFG